MSYNVKYIVTVNTFYKVDSVDAVESWHVVMMCCFVFLGDHARSYRVIKDTKSPYNFYPASRLPIAVIIRRTLSEKSTIFDKILPNNLIFGHWVKHAFPDYLIIFKIGWQSPHAFISSHDRLFGQNIHSLFSIAFYSKKRKKYKNELHNVKRKL